MVRVCSGNTLPHGVKGKWYLLRRLATRRTKSTTSPIRRSRRKLMTVVDGLTGTHKSWWECDTGIAYLVANKREEGWHGGNHLKIYDLSDPAKPVYIRDFGMVGTQPGASASDGGEGIHGADLGRSREEPRLHRLRHRQRRRASRSSIARSC